MGGLIKYVKKSSKYKHVYCKSYKKREFWIFELHISSKNNKDKTVKRTTKSFQTEREAALAVDKLLLSLGLPPVNILKPKQ